MNKYRNEEYVKQNGVDFPVPAHVGIIMDGNGRWAKQRLMPRHFGHAEGVSRLRSIARCSSKLGIEVLTVYAFSTENWKRSADEVQGLMDLLCEHLVSSMSAVMDSHIRIVRIGENTRLSERVLSVISEAEEKTKDNDGMILNIAFNYGSRSEIVYAVKSIADEVKSGRLNTDEITEKLISDRLYTGGQPDPDVIIRTSGEMRISNFLLYQMAYSEIMVVPDYWPAFSDKRYIETLRDFSKRSRRFGGVSE